MGFIIVVGVLILLGIIMTCNNYYSIIGSFVLAIGIIGIFCITIPIIKVKYNTVNFICDYETNVHGNFFHNYDYAILKTRKLKDDFWVGIFQPKIDHLLLSTEKTNIEK